MPAAPGRLAAHLRWLAAVPDALNMRPAKGSESGSDIVLNGSPPFIGGGARARARCATTCWRTTSRRRSSHSKRKDMGEVDIATVTDFAGKSVRVAVRAEEAPPPLPEGARCSLAALALSGSALERVKELLTSRLARREAPAASPRPFSSVRRNTLVPVAGHKDASGQKIETIAAFNSFSIITEPCTSVVMQCRFGADSVERDWKFMSYVKTRFQVGPFVAGRYVAERRRPAAAPRKGALGLCGAMLFGLAVGVAASLFQGPQAPAVSDTMGWAKARIAALMVQSLGAVRGS